MRNILISLSIFVLLTIPAWAFARDNMNGPLLASFGLTDQQFENKAKEYLGVPYRKGGVSRRGMDCSGFARVLYNKLFNIDLPHNSIDQFQFSGLQEISSKKMQPGDLVFFANRKQKSINHVGVYLSNGKFIHASTSQGITVSKLSDRYWKKRFVG
jgi:cell wall-associated NlpC family hydrolase